MHAVDDEGARPNGPDGATAKDMAEEREVGRQQLAAIFKALLTLAADEPMLLQRLLLADALYALLASLEAEESRETLSDTQFTQRSLP